MMSPVRFPRTLGALALSLILAGAAHAADHYVPSGGASTFATIQDALNSGDVSDGDTIFVTGGASYGPLTIGKSVTIENTSGNTVTITGGGDGVLINNGASPTLDGFTISGNSANGIAIADAGTVTILNCIITGNNTGGNDSAIQITGPTSPTIIIEDSNLDGNARRAFTVDAAGAGGSLTATNTTFSGNGETSIFTGAPGTPIAMTITLNECTINGNGTGGFGRGIQVFGGTVNLNGGAISNNNNQGLMSDGGAGGVAFNVDGTEISGNGEQGVALFAQGDYTFTNADISTNNGIGIFRIFNPVATPTALTLVDSTVNGNTGEGIFLDFQMVDLEISGSELRGNADGGDSQLRIIGDQVVNATIEGSYFDWNNSGANMVLVAPGSYTLRNSVINGGGGGVGNILAENGGTFVFEHCTLVSAPGASSAGIFSGGGADCNFTVRNTIFAGVEAGIVNNRAGNSWDVDYSLFHPNGVDIAGDEAGAVGGIGANSLTGSPEFVANTTGFGTGDFRLTATSPALAAGTDLSIAGDIDAAPRPNPTASAPDMGAHEAGPATALSVSSVDFGQALVDTPANGSVDVVNTGVQTVTVSAMTITGTDAAAFSIDSPTAPFDVDPSDSVTVKLVFEGSTAGSYTDAKLELTTNDANSPGLEADLEGVAVEGPVIDLDPAGLAFGEILAGESDTLTFQISNIGDEPLSITGLSITGTDAGAYSLVSPPTTPFTVNTGSPETITVEFAPGSVASFDDAAVEVASNDTGQPTASVTLTGQGVEGPVIDLDPASLGFGQVETGQADTLTFQIINDGDQPLSITAMTITGTDAAAYSLVSPPATPFTVESGSPQTITVEFSPGAEAVYNDAGVEITSNDPGEGTVTLPLTGEGIVVSTVNDWMMLND